MTALAIIASAAAAFLFGFLFGTLGLRYSKKAAHSKPADNEEIEKLRREFSNFLSYDGTEQSQR